MKRTLAFGVILVFAGVMLAGPVEATHQRYEFRYYTGSAFGAGITSDPECMFTRDGVTHAIGGACQRPCPHGRCRITVHDDQRGSQTWFRIRINDDVFYQPALFRDYEIVEANKVAVAVMYDDATTGSITIEAI